MKNLFKITLAFSFIALILSSCKKEENQVVYEGGTPPAFSAVSLAPTVLLKANQNDNANTFMWTNPEYRFNTGISSQDVTYTIQIDTVGANFTSPVLAEKVVTKQLSTGITVKELNTMLLARGLNEDMLHHLEIRIKSTLVNSTAVLYSAPIHWDVTPYLDVVVTLPKDLPTPNSNNGDLFLVGDATSGGWNNPVPVPSQKFTQISNVEYQIITNLIGGKEYLFLPKNGDWSHKYAVANKTLPGLSAGGSFGADLSDNFPGPSASGSYLIDVNFKTGLFTVTPH